MNGWNNTVVSNNASQSRWNLNLYYSSHLIFGDMFVILILVTRAILALSSVSIWRKEYECFVASEQAAQLKIVFQRL